MAPKEIPLKRNNKHNPQIKSYTDAIKSGQKNIHIFPKQDSWEVKKIGSSDIKIYSSKHDAVSGAKKDASRSGGEIFIHNRNGLIETRLS